MHAVAWGRRDSGRAVLCVHGYSGNARDFDDLALWKWLVRHGARRVDGGYALHYDPQIARVVRPMPYAAGLYFWDAWYRVRRARAHGRRAGGSRARVPAAARACLGTTPRARCLLPSAP